MQQQQSLSWQQALLLAKTEDIKEQENGTILVTVPVSFEITKEMYAKWKEQALKQRQEIDAKISNIEAKTSILTKEVKK